MISMQLGQWRLHAKKHASLCAHSFIFRCMKILMKVEKLRSDYCIFSRINAYAWKKISDVIN